MLPLSRITLNKGYFLKKYPYKYTSFYSIRTYHSLSIQNVSTISRNILLIVIKL